MASCTEDFINLYPSKKAVPLFQVSGRNIDIIIWIIDHKLFILAVVTHKETDTILQI